MQHRARLAALLFTTALTSAGAALPALAQQAAAPASGAGDSAMLGDIVVTATKQADTVARVPLSVSASTQKSLDQQGIRTVTDLSRAVPALTVTSANTSGVASFTIRGITTGGSAGAATVGVYLDDTNVTKRQVTGPGGAINNNGSPLPALFDLERVEVLRGPQGTLYGGSSEGGTIRFITPAPSTSTYSTYDRATIATTKDGSASYDLGVAVGGPIIKDKLGFRASIYGQRTGGWIDHVDPYSQQVVSKDTNWGDAKGLHVSALWRPIENASVLFSLFMNESTQNDASSWNLPTGAITRPALCTSYTGLPTTSGNPRLVNCAAPAAATPITYRYPSFTYGPYNLAPYQTLNPANSPAHTFSQIPTLTLEYDLPHMTVKSITSYFHDESKSLNYDTSILTSLTGPNGQPGCGTATAAATGAVVGCQATPGNPNGNPAAVIFFQTPNGTPVNYFGQFKVRNERRGISEELRFNSDNEGPVTWVGGLYFSYTNARFGYINNEDYNTPGLLMFGLTSGQRYAEVNQDPSRGPVLGPAPPPCNVNNQSGYYPFLVNNQGQPVANGGSGACFPLQELSNEAAAYRLQHLKDTEIAGFGEVTVHITDRLRAIGGLRLSRVEFKFDQRLYGVNIGYNNPTTFNGGLVSGSQTESPILPKVGIQYQLDDRNQVYATASKGFRPGGVNSPISGSLCSGLSQSGLTPQDIPVTYNSDTVWSYEGGAKLRLLGNRVALNSSVYRIDWTNVQVAIPTTGCGQTYNLNAGRARSEGFDLDAQARLLPGLMLSAAVGYDNARYTTATTGPKPLSGAPATVVVNAGDKLAVPPWTVSLGGEYDFSPMSGIGAYVRADYRYTSKYQNTFGPGTTGYQPDVFFLPQAQNVNARIGLTSGGIDFSIFVNNLFNSKDYLSETGGRSGCNVTTGAACTLYSTYTPVYNVTSFAPRTIGAQIVYRH